MKYPLDVEVCVEALIEAEEHKEKGIKFMRAYVTTLNEFYAEGLNSPDAATADEVFNVITHDSVLRENLKSNFERFLEQAKDAYNQGIIDAGKTISSIHSRITS